MNKKQLLIIIMPYIYISLGVLIALFYTTYENYREKRKSSKRSFKTMD